MNTDKINLHLFLRFLGRRHLMSRFKLRLMILVFDSDKDILNEILSQTTGHLKCPIYILS